ncbi:MAG: PHP-associated domain-containing protein [Dehalococcoidia bacterium]|nr:PHP-associated domain-containing protein [Dehalococcoidia bacterium]
MSKADLHIHSCAGDAIGSLEEMFDHVENNTDLAVIAITDHDDIEGGLSARNLAARRNHRFQVVVGTEITTMDGHLLALFIEKPVRSLQSLSKTVDAVHAQGGLCVVPHPMSWLTRSVGRRALVRIVGGKMPGVYLDGIEIINATVAGRVSNDKALKLNRSQFNLAETGGSDAHFTSHIGSAYTVFPGSTAEDLRRSLENRLTRAERCSIQPSLPGVDKLLAQQVRSLIVLPYKHVRKRVKRMLTKER